MLLPTILIDASLGYYPLHAAPVFTTLPGVRAFEIVRGRNTEYDMFQGGTLSLVLSSEDGLYVPQYSASQFYPNLKPMVLIRIRAVLSGTTYPMIVVFADDWPPQWIPGDEFAIVTATDAIGILRGRKLSGTYPTEMSDDRVVRVLDAVGWPGTGFHNHAGWRSIGVGITTLDAVTLDKVSAMEHLELVARSETARIFVDASGAVKFVGRHALMSSPYIDSQATYGDISGELPYSNPVASYGKSGIYNEVIVTTASGTAVTKTDTDSIAYYTTKTLTRSNVLCPASEAAAMAQFLLLRRMQPQLRINNLTFHPDQEILEWQDVLQRELSDRCTIRRRPDKGLHPTNPTLLEQESHIEGIRHSVSFVRDTWNCERSFSLADTSNYLVLGHATRGMIDSTNRLAY